MSTSARSVHPDGKSANESVRNVQLSQARRDLLRAVEHRQVHALGRATAVWLCDEENTASRALAARCGFELGHVVPRLTRAAG